MSTLKWSELKDFNVEMVTLQGATLDYEYVYSFVHGIIVNGDAQTALEPKRHIFSAMLAWQNP